jgi:hypothetical protein
MRRVTIGLATTGLFATLVPLAGVALAIGAIVHWQWKVTLPDGVHRTSGGRCRVDFVAPTSSAGPTGTGTRTPSARGPRANS